MTEISCKNISIWFNGYFDILIETATNEPVIEQRLLTDASYSSTPGRKVLLGRGCPHGSSDDVYHPDIKREVE